MYQKYIKRLFDIIFSAIGIIALSPVMLVTAVLVRIKLGSPVIFKQERPGRNEKIFEMYKFRSMADKRDQNGNLLPDKERLPEFGKKLRASSLDELPELFNVLKGDMSLVGPRPLLVQYLPLYSERQRHRHDVRPGITGLAQVKGRNAINWEEKFEWDIRYVENVTLLNDIDIIKKTFKTVFSKNGICEKNNVTVQPFVGDKK